jgi:hypothetical protein
LNALKLVFSHYKYLILSASIFISILIPLLIVSEYIFLEPYLIGHVSEGRELGFSLIIILSGMAGLVLPMNVYRIQILRSSKRKMSGSVFGSIIGSAAGACGCGPVGFAIFSTFGSLGAAASAFLTNYEIPIRLIAIVLLAVTYFTTIRSLKIECSLNN